MIITNFQTGVMKNIFLLAWLFLFAMTASSQQVIKLYPAKAPGSENWNWNEKEYFSNVFNTQIVYNVSQPTITVYLPEKSVATGTAVVIAPGGAFHLLSINSEGVEVAQWLNKKGIAAFVLKYRLEQTRTDDAVKEMMANMQKPEKMEEIVKKIVPLSIADGLAAIRYVKANASTFGIDPAKTGFMGFSAGGTVTLGVTYGYDQQAKPAFAAPIYPFVSADLSAASIPADAPPLFICAATNDGLKLASHSTGLYTRWANAGKSVELHMFAKGDHGFGMRKQNLPSDKWIERFYEWLKMQGF